VKRSNASAKAREEEERQGLGNFARRLRGVVKAGTYGAVYPKLRPERRRVREKEGVGGGNFGAQRPPEEARNGRYRGGEGRKDDDYSVASL